MKTVVIAQEDLLYTYTLARACSWAGLKVVGGASSWQGAVELAKEKRPDVVILGDFLPNEGDGRKAAEQIKQHLPTTHIVAYSSTNWGFGDEGFSKEEVGWEELVKYILSL